MAAPLQFPRCWWEGEGWAAHRPTVTGAIQIKKPVASPGQGSQLPHQRCRARLARREHLLLKKERQEAALTLCNAISTPCYFSAPFTVQLLSYDRIIECFGWEGTFRGHLAQPPCNEKGHLQLDQVAQSPVQPGLECFQGWGLHYFSGQPVPVPHYPHGEEFLP